MQRSDSRCKLAIDCSSTRTCNFNSGIQRVVRKLCEQAKLIPNAPLDGVAVFGQEGMWIEAKSTWPTPICTLNSTNTPYKRNKGLPAKIARELQRVIRRVSRRIRPLTPAPAGTIVEFSRGDIVFLADASWMAPNWEAIDFARSREAAIGLLIYDLIPILHPNLFERRLVDRFTEWFDQVIDKVDFIACISKSVAADVIAELSKRNGFDDLIQRTFHFPLGANLEGDQETNLPSKDILNWFNKDRSLSPCLVVGTLEPRKNHHLILDAFEQLWRQGSPLQLCLLGRIGWNCESLIARIENSPELGKKLLVKTDASDADVSYAYACARSVIMASKCEGYGLPIAEGIGHRQLVLASDIPVHREVGSDLVHYFSIERGPHALHDLLSRLERNEVTLPKFPPSNSLQQVSWEESYRTLCARMVEVLESADPIDSSESRRPLALHALT